MIQVSPSQKQASLIRPLEIAGKGLHTGKNAVLKVLPAPAGSGIAFVRADLPGAPRIPAVAARVTATERGTVVQDGTASVSTIEHLLGAFYGLGLDNALVEIDGPEVPILDGSALPWVHAIRQAGIQAFETPRQVARITEPFEFSEGGKRFYAAPASQLLVTFHIDYGHAHLSSQSTSLVITPESFAQWVAPARTFCFEHEIEAMRKAGLAQGGDLTCALVIGREGLMNPPLRFPDEFVRHKILDFLGDLSLFGRPLRGHFTLDRSGHTFNVKSVRRMLEKSVQVEAPAA